MTPTEILIAAREKIEQGWTQKTYARSEDGDSVAYNSLDAVCWCPIGAIVAVNRSRAGDRAIEILAEAVEVTTSRLTEWNDAPDRTQDEVIIAFGWAIEASKRAPQRGRGSHDHS